MSSQASSCSSVGSSRHPVTKRRRVDNFESRFLDLPPVLRRGIVDAAHAAAAAFLRDAKERIRGMTGTEDLSEEVQRELEDVLRATDVLGIPADECAQRLGYLLLLRARATTPVNADEEWRRDAEFWRVASAPWEEEEEERRKREAKRRKLYCLAHARAMPSPRLRLVTTDAEPEIDA